MWGNRFKQPDDDRREERLPIGRAVGPQGVVQRKVNLEQYQGVYRASGDPGIGLSLVK
jgi:hypothetical protein